MAGILGIIGKSANILPHAVLMAVLFFYNTENCGYSCNEFFEHLPQDQPVRIYQDQSNPALAIVGNDDSRQVEIYIPSKMKMADKETTCTKEETITRTYKKSR